MSVAANCKEWWCVLLITPFHLFLLDHLAVRKLMPFLIVVIGRSRQYASLCKHTSKCLLLE
jgi:hypothetical protein